jgi:hypothetical protein
MAQLVGDQNQPVSGPPRDAELAQMLERTAKDAQEQMHFHASQLRMWERVSNAAQVGLDALHADDPKAEESAFHVEGRRY